MSLQSKDYKDMGTMLGARIGGTMPESNMGIQQDQEDTSPLPFMANLASALAGIREQKKAQKQEQSRWDSLINALSSGSNQGR